MKRILRWSALAIVAAIAVAAGIFAGWEAGAAIAFLFLTMAAFAWRAAYASEGIQNWSRARFEDNPDQRHWSSNKGAYFDHRSHR